MKNEEILKEFEEKFGTMKVVSKDELEMKSFAFYGFMKRWIRSTLQKQQMLQGTHNFGVAIAERERAIKQRDIEWNGALNSVKTNLDGITALQEVQKIMETK